MNYLINAADSQEEQDRQKHRRVAEALFNRRFGQMPTDFGGGLAAIGDALAQRAANVKAQGPFPTAPGGQPVGFGTRIANKFGFGKGGLW